MAEANLVQEGMDRFREAFGSIDGEFQRVQKDLKTRRRTFEKQTRKQIKRLRTEARKSTALKQIEDFQEDVGKQVERGVSRVLDVLQIASRGDVQRIDKKLNQISRKVKELERLRKSNGEAHSAL